METCQQGVHAQPATGPPADEFRPGVSEMNKNPMGQQQLYVNSLKDLTCCNMISPAIRRISLTGSDNTKICNLVSDSGFQCWIQPFHVYTAFVHVCMFDCLDVILSIRLARNIPEIRFLPLRSATVWQLYHRYIRQQAYQPLVHKNIVSVYSTDQKLFKVSIWLKP